MGVLLPKSSEDRGAPLPANDPLWVHALDVFNGSDRATVWFYARHIQFGMSPVEVLQHPDGRQRLEAILTGIEHGLPA